MATAWQSESRLEGGEWESNETSFLRVSRPEAASWTAESWSIGAESWALEKAVRSSTAMERGNWRNGNKLNEMEKKKGININKQKEEKKRGS